jgi:hypothetical protein
LVPILWRGNMEILFPSEILHNLHKHGSYAAPGFDKPEGIVIFHSASGSLFKKTLGGDGAKGPRN